MKKFIHLTVSCLAGLSLCFLLVGFKAANTLTGTQLMQQAQGTLVADNEIAKLKLTMLDGAGYVQSREIISASYNLGKGKWANIVYLAQPEAVRGTLFLGLSEKDPTNPDAAPRFTAYTYLPALDTTRRIENFEQMESFLGSDFSYRDLYVELAPQHAYRRLTDVTHAGQNCHRVEAMFRPTGGGPRSHHRRVYYINSANKHIVRVDHYNPEGDLVKTLDLDGYDEIAQTPGKPPRPKRAIMTVQTDGSTSVLLLLEDSMHAQLKPEWFSPKALPTWQRQVLPKLRTQLGV